MRAYFFEGLAGVFLFAVCLGIRNTIRYLRIYKYLARETENSLAHIETGAGSSYYAGKISVIHDIEYIMQGGKLKR